MRRLSIFIASCGIALAGPADDFLAAAKQKHGAFGEKAARFLIEHMPESDRAALDAGFLIENLDLAFKARDAFPWAKGIPEDRFLNDVLPYAVFDEPRDPWRAGFLEKATPLVKDAKSASEAAQILNKEFFKLINTHYDTGRRRTNQSPEESIAQGKATCTGLSILLVDACRAVGIPARAVGTPMWTNGRGNHTWVEIWDGGWHFTGADEYDAKGLNRGWFTGDAAKAMADLPVNAIYATSWQPRGTHFPLVWSPENRSVGGVNVTARYASEPAAKPQLGIRLMDGGTRMAVPGALVSSTGDEAVRFTTKAGTADLNDMPRVEVAAGATFRARFLIGDRVFESQPVTAAAGETTLDADKATLKPLVLDAATAASFIALAWENQLATQRMARQAELEAKEIKHGDKTLRWLEKSFGNGPAGGRSLWISMHGGGGAPPAVNDRQWHNQIQLYEPAEGIYVAPRAPTDTWNLWHQGHIDPMFSRLIENMVALRGVDPDKVYLMGYSAGGDGVWQLAPRMADRFAAAAMMAGHPNESQPDGLRNLPFAIFVGANDSAYDRNKIVAARAAKLAGLHAADPDGYVHMARVYEGLGHWMNRKDAEALPWMARFTRNPWPEKFVWLQDDITHDRFYWLQLPAGFEKKAGHKITATVDGHKISLAGDVPKGTRLLLNDALLDVDQPVIVTVNEQPAREFKVSRSLGVIRRALAGRLDPKSCPTAEIILE